MEFLVIVLGMAILYGMGSLPALQRDGWYKKWVASLCNQKLLGAIPQARLLFSLFLPVLAVCLAVLLLQGYWFGLPLFGLNLLALLYSFGRGNLNEQVETYSCDLWRDDLQAAFHDAAIFNAAHREGSAENWPELHGEVLQAISYRYFEHYFAAIFWFMVAGAPAVVLYRLSRLHPDLELDGETEQLAAARWLWLMEWLPVRLLGLSFALVGNFAACFRHWQGSLFCPKSGTATVLRHYVEGALAINLVVADQPVKVAEVGAIKALFARALVLMFSVIALLVVFI